MKKMTTSVFEYKCFTINCYWNTFVVVLMNFNDTRNYTWRGEKGKAVLLQSSKGPECG
jgi:hypothetical protein